MIFLTKREFIAINQLVISRSDSELLGVQYPQGLDIVVKQPRQVLFGQELYPNVWLKAAFIIQKVTKKHIFADGNKRTAIIAGVTFLEANGYKLDFTAEAGESLILSVTNSPDDDRIMLTLAEWLKRHCININK